METWQVEGSFWLEAGSSEVFSLTSPEGLGYNQVSIGSVSGRERERGSINRNPKVDVSKGRRFKPLLFLTHNTSDILKVSNSFLSKHILQSTNFLYLVPDVAFDYVNY